MNKSTFWYYVPRNKFDGHVLVIFKCKVCCRRGYYLLERFTLYHVNNEIQAKGVADFSIQDNRALDRKSLFSSRDWVIEKV